MWELKYTFQEPVGEIRITEDWSGEGNGIAGLQWLGGVVLRYAMATTHLIFNAQSVFTFHLRRRQFMFLAFAVLRRKMA